MMPAKLGLGRWDNVLRETLVALGLVTGFVVAYLPGILLDTIGTPDDHKIFWVGDTKECCFSAWDSQNWAYIGRAVGSLIANIQFAFIYELVDLVPVRVFSAICTALGCFGIYRYLRRELDLIPALMVAVGICMVPAFFLGIVWAHAFAFLTIPPFLAFCAGIIALDRPTYLGGTIGSAITSALIFIIVLYIYQPSAMFFVLPLVINILFFRNFAEKTIIIKTVWIFSIFVVASAIYYVIHRFIFLPRFIAAYPHWGNEISHARFILFGAEGTEGLIRELARKFSDLSMMTLIAFNGVWPVPAKSVAAVVAVVILAGLAFFGWRDLPAAIPARRVTWRGILAISVLALLTTAPTIAAAGGYTPVRIASAYAAIIISALVWAVFRLLARLRGAVPVIAALAAIILIPMIQNLALYSNATARTVYDSTKALLSANIPYPIATLWVIGAEQRPAMPLAGHEITSVTVSKLSVDLVLAELGYRYGPGFRFREIRSPTEEMGLSERDAVVDLRFLNRHVPNAFQKFRLDQANKVHVADGRCGPVEQVRNLASPLSAPGWTASHLEIGATSVAAGAVRAQGIGESPLQRLSRRILVPRGRTGDQLQVNLSVYLAEGADRAGVRFTLLPDVAQLFADANLRPGIWQCASFSLVAPVDFEFTDFFIYPTTTSSDRGPARPGLTADLADLQIIHLPRLHQSDLPPLRRLWRLRSVDRSEEAVAQSVRLLDDRPDTVWKIQGRPNAGVMLELPEAPAVLTGVRLTRPVATVISPPTEVRISGSDDGLTWIPLMVAKLSQEGARGQPDMLSIGNDRAFRLISLDFSSAAPEWGIGDIVPVFQWR